jgi:hypothetical protein
MKIKRRQKPKKEKPKSYDRCRGPLSPKEYCEGCEKVIECLDTHLKWYSSIPHFIVDKYLWKLSPSAAKIFVFLNKSAEFDPASRHFGRCWFRYEQIEEETGVAASNMAKYIDELEDANLIKHKLLRFVKKNQIRTAHQFTVTWHKRMRLLRHGAKKVLRKKKRNR